MTSAYSRMKINAAHDWHRFDDWLKSILRIYGALRLSSPGDWGRATVELGVTVIFALLPIWVPLIVYPMFGTDRGGAWDIIYEQIKHGELYFLSTALLAPIFYFTFPGARSTSSADVGQFPSQRVLILIFVLILILSVLAIAASKLQSEATGIPPRMVRWINSALVRGNRPVSSTRVGKTSGPKTARSSTSARCRPTSSFGFCCASATASSNALPVTSNEALVTIPS